MAAPTTAARRYAEAALEIARRDGTLDAWLVELRLAVELVGADAAATVVDNPAIAWVHRRAIITALLGSRVGALTRNLVLLLARRGRLAILPRVADEFAQIVDREHGVVIANVTSAQSLEPAELAAVAARIQASPAMATAVAVSNTASRVTPAGSSPNFRKQASPRNIEIT